MPQTSMFLAPARPVRVAIRIAAAQAGQAFMLASTAVTVGARTITYCRSQMSAHLKALTLPAVLAAVKLGTIGRAVLDPAISFSVLKPIFRAPISTIAEFQVSVVVRNTIWIGLGLCGAALAMLPEAHLSTAPAVLRMATLISEPSTVSRQTSNSTIPQPAIALAAVSNT